MLRINAGKTGMNVAAARVRAVGNDFEVDFTPHPHGGRERLWFHFGLEFSGNPAPGGRTLLTLKNINTMLGSGQGGFRPVIRYSGGAWQRLPPGEKHVRPDGYASLRWSVDTPEDTLEIAFCFPYGPDELDAMLADTGGYWRVDEIGVTSNGRPLRRLSNNYGSTKDRRPGFYVLGRQHAMETSGAWVLDGLLRRWAERKSPLTLWCVPMVGLDGILAGDYGKDSFPQDINRAWGPNAPMRHENLTLIHDMQSQWRERVGEDSLLMDFHSPGADEKDVYVFIRREMPEEWGVRERLLRLQGDLGVYAAPDFIRHGDYKPTSAWGDQWNLGEFAVHKLKMRQFSMETSYYEAGGEVLEIADYQRIGRIIADRLHADESAPGR